jgi:hypothetical protein
MVISNRVSVDLVVCGMRTDESYPSNLVIEIESDDQSVLVAFDVEDNAASLENTGAWMVRLQIMNVAPISLFRLPEPRLQLLLTIGMLGPKLPKCALGYDPHDRWIWLQI